MRASQARALTMARHVKSRSPVPQKTLVWQAQFAPPVASGNTIWIVRFGAALQARRILASVKAAGRRLMLKCQLALLEMSACAALTEVALNLVLGLISISFWFFAAARQDRHFWR